MRQITGAEILAKQKVWEFVRVGDKMEYFSGLADRIKKQSLEMDKATKEIAFMGNFGIFAIFCEIHGKFLRCVHIVGLNICDNIQVSSYSSSTSSHVPC